jgi:CheY-like chemotaxis protein
MPSGVLCVSGDGPTAQELCRMLRKLRFQAEAASTMSQALAVINRRPPSLLIIDFLLADGSGLELVRQLRMMRRTARLPVLMLATTLQAEHYRPHFIAGGPQDWLYKPVDEERLATAVMRWVGVELTDAGAVDEIETDQAGALADNGKISELPFARVLALAGRRGAGSLQIERRDQWLRVWLTDDAIHAIAAGRLSGVPLGQMLVMQGRISRTTLNEAQAAIGPDGNLGQWLCDQGYLCHDELGRQIRQQVMQELTDLFSWRWYDGVWRYEANAPLADYQAECDLPIRNVVFAGIAKFYDRDRLEMIFSKRERLRRPIIPTTPFYEDFAPPARRLLDNADGRSTPAVVRARAGMELLRFYQTLYSLWVMDVVRFGEPIKPDPQQPSPDKDIFLKPHDDLDFVRRH